MLLGDWDASESSSSWKTDTGVGVDTVPGNVSCPFNFSWSSWKTDAGVGTHCQCDGSEEQLLLEPSSAGTSCFCCPGRAKNPRGGAHSPHVGVRRSPRAKRCCLSRMWTSASSWPFSGTLVQLPTTSGTSNGRARIFPW